MTSSETRLHSGEGTVGFEMVGNLFVNLAEEGDDRGNFPIFGDLRRYKREVEQASNRGCNNCYVNAQCPVCRQLTLFPHKLTPLVSQGTN